MFSVLRLLPTDILRIRGQYVRLQEGALTSVPVFHADVGDILVADGKAWMIMAGLALEPTVVTCVGCGSPLADPTQRWCSRSCWQAEDTVYEPEDEHDSEDAEA